MYFISCLFGLRFVELCESLGFTLLIKFGKCLIFLLIFIPSLQFSLPLLRLQTAHILRCLILPRSSIMLCSVSPSFIFLCFILDHFFAFTSTAGALHVLYHRVTALTRLLFQTGLGRLPTPAWNLRAAASWAAGVAGVGHHTCFYSFPEASV